MSYVYECLGRDEYRQEEREDDPYKRGNTYNAGRVFRDFFNYNHGKRFTPEELGVTYPYPDYYTGSDGLVYRKREVELENHQFTNPGMQGPRMNTPLITGETFTPFVKEKEQKTDNTGYEMGNTAHSLKQRGLLK